MRPKHIKARTLVQLLEKIVLKKTYKTELKTKIIELSVREYIFFRS